MNTTPTMTAEALAADLDTMHDVYMSRAQREAFDRIVARCEALQADAERLDWLEVNGTAVRSRANSSMNLLTWYRKDVRAAIDTARKEREG